MSIKKCLVPLILNILILIPQVCPLKSSNSVAEEIEKNGGGGGSGHSDYPRYGSSSSSLSSAAAAAAAAASSIYPAAMNYYSNSYYPTLGPSPYRYNPFSGVGSAEPPYERTAREYSTSNSNTAGAGYIGNDLIPAEDNGGHVQHSSGHGGGHGWGWGWGHGHGKDNNLSNTGFGLLGLLGLLSVLQQVLNQMTTTTAAPMGRKKRNIREENNKGYKLHNRITQLVLPNLNIIAHASNGNLPLECTHRETCIVNGIFLKEFGEQGNLIGYHMSSAIVNMLKNIDNTGQIKRYLDVAGQNGRNGLNCHEIYPICNKLYRNGTIAYPPSLLLK